MGKLKVAIIAIPTNNRILAAKRKKEKAKTKVLHTTRLQMIVTMIKIGTIKTS